MPEIQLSLDGKSPKQNRRKNNNISFCLWGSKINLSNIPIWLMGQSVSTLTSSNIVKNWCKTSRSKCGIERISIWLKKVISLKLVNFWICIVFWLSDISINLAFLRYKRITELAEMWVKNPKLLIKFYIVKTCTWESRCNFLNFSNKPRRTMTDFSYLQPSLQPWV